MQYFFSSELIDSRFVFDQTESAHVTKVLRRNVGEKIHVLDGNGKAYKAEILTVGKQVEAKLLEIMREEAAPQLNLTIAVGPTKRQERMEWMVEKLTEIGISKLVFIESQRGERTRINRKRLAKKALSALKQSGNLWLPEISSGVNLSDFISSNNSDQKFIAHCMETGKSNLPAFGQQNSSICVMIGPEGDFTSKELELAVEHEFVPLTLGVPRYRTETAAVVACTLVNHFCVTLAENN